MVDWLPLWVALECGLVMGWEVLAGCCSPVYFWEAMCLRGGWNSITCLCAANSREDVSMEPSILNRGANIYSDIKYCMYSLRSSHSWTIIYRTHTSPFAFPLQNIQYAENMYFGLILFIKKQENRRFIHA